MAEPNEEKSPIEPSDYEGLQLDTRAKDSTEKDLDTTRNPKSPRRGPVEYSDEKNFITEAEAREARGYEESPYSAVSAIDSSKAAVIGDGAPPPRKVQRICGLRRAYFWLLFGTILAIIIVAAVVGGVVGGMRHGSSNSTSSSSSSQSGSSSNTSTVNEADLPESDVIVGSPIQLVAYTSNTSTGSIPSNDQSFRLYFQSAHGNIKEMGLDGTLTPWNNATPIFTDARNNTGLAVVNYMNGTSHQSSIYYVDSHHGLLQEKRNYPNTTTRDWLPGSLNSQIIRAIGSIPLPVTNSQQDPTNAWDSFAMAAAYSPNFHSGPGSRLFYHAQAANGTAYVQEMLWNQTGDSWTDGATLLDPWPNSQLAVTIDESTQLLRLFYSAGNLTLRESWLNISDPTGQYHQGLNIPGFLAHNDAAIAAVSVNGSALVYHYAQIGVLGIRELNISGTPGSTSNQENYNLTQSIVSQPALYVDKQLSIYQPIGATVTTVSGLTPQIYVFWAEQNVGATGGYGSLVTVSRNVNATSWPNSSYGNSTGSVQLPLGISNTDP